jgi:hypothetical protein
VSDRTQYWADYYESNRKFIRLRQQIHQRGKVIEKLLGAPTYRRPRKSKIERAAVRAEWQRTNYHARKVARVLGVRLAVARAMLAKRTTSD